MKLIGLTGSIGTGKTTTAALFAAEGVPVYDADASVHALYAEGGAAVARVGAAFPGVVRGSRVDREALSKAVLQDREALSRLEDLVHPLLAAERARFLARAEADGADLVVLDVPLLFETGAETMVSAVVVTTCPSEEQRRRVLERPGMTQERLEAILARQLPDAEKRRRADFVVDTAGGVEAARAEVSRILQALRCDCRHPSAENGRLS